MSEITISVPEAGRRYFGLGKNAAYRAAEAGQIPTVRVGGLLRVPVNKMDELVGVAAVAPQAKSATLFPGDAFDFLCSIYRDEGLPLQLRAEAAIALLPYVRRPLAPIDVSDTRFDA
jgi:hypothetical protein